MVQLIDTLPYKPKGRGFDSRWYYWKFSLRQFFRPHYDPGIYAAANRNEYQEYFLGGKGGRCIGLTIIPTSCVDFLEIWEPKPPGTLRSCLGRYRVVLPQLLPETLHHSADSFNINYTEMTSLHASLLHFHSLALHLQLVSVTRRLILCLRV